jgi:uroporphyrinogen-III synthase
MAMPGPLHNQRILVTRPEAQSKALIEKIQAHGGLPICVPVITIEATTSSEWASTNLTQADWLIFVSTNAVDIFFDHWQGALSHQVQYAAVGAATAKALRQRGIRVNCQPETSNGSEGLLIQAAMQSVAGQHIVIVRGQGGREHLAEILSERGASIQYIEVYRRGLAEPNPAQREAAMMADVVICTSVASVDNLCTIFADDIGLLLTKKLLVVSERIRTHALAQGFQQVSVSAEASDDSMLTTLMEMEA